MRVVIVEDNQELSTLLANNLSEVGIESDQAFTGFRALDEVDPDIHDLVILDRGLPDMDGIDVLKSLREDGVSIPVLILTAMDGLGDKVMGLNSGADDYLIKPFEIDELIARVHALHRRPANAVDVILRVGNLEFFPSDNVARVGGTETNFTAKEKEALHRLMRLPERVVSKEALENVLYGYGSENSKNSVEVVIHRLRKKLLDCQANVEIHTLRGIGYLMKQKQAA